MAWGSGSSTRPRTASGGSSSTVRSMRRLQGYFRWAGLVNSERQVAFDHRPGPSDIAGFGTRGHVDGELPRVEFAAAFWVDSGIGRRVWGALLVGGYPAAHCGASSWSLAQEGMAPLEVVDSRLAKSSMNPFDANVISPLATLDPSVSLSHGAVIHENVTIAGGTTVGNHVVIMPDVRIGSG